MICLLGANSLLSWILLSFVQRLHGHGSRTAALRSLQNARPGKDWIARDILPVRPDSAILRRFGRWVERAILGELPVYGAVKSLSRGLVGSELDGVFKPAILGSPNGEREIVYMIEDNGQGLVTVLVPWAPASFSGSVKILSRDRIDLLEASLGDTSMVLSHWGVGAMKLLAREESRDGDRRVSHDR